MVALGTTSPGLMSNDDAWSQQVLAAAAGAGEKAWPLPMFPHYGEMIKSDVADMKNTGGTRYAGAITAAKFLEEFVGDVAVGAPRHRRPGLGREAKTPPATPAAPAASCGRWSSWRESIECSWTLRGFTSPHTIAFEARSRFRARNPSLDRTLRRNSK